MSKALKVFFITLLSILIVGLVAFLILVLTNRIDLKNFKFTSLVSKELVFEKEVKRIASGQSIVVYDKEVCLGGGIVAD